MSSLSLFLNQRQPCIQLPTKCLFWYDSMYKPELILPASLVLPIVMNSTHSKPETYLSQVPLLTPLQNPASFSYHVQYHMDTVLPFSLQCL